MALVKSEPKTLALGIEYRGTAFNGWQVQPDHPSVQAALEAALSQFADHPISVICAGRTDTGVHATHQVVSFTSVARRPSAGWIRGVNAILPESVAVRWMREVDEKFHARFSARSRTYEYWIWNDPVRSPLFEGSAGWVFRPLDEALMQRGAMALIGEHDFTSFRASECQAQDAGAHDQRTQDRAARRIGGRTHYGQCLFAAHGAKHRWRAYLCGHGTGKA